MPLEGVKLKRERESGGERPFEKCVGVKAKIENKIEESIEWMDKEKQATENQSNNVENRSDRDGRQGEGKCDTHTHTQEKTKAPGKM